MLQKFLNHQFMSVAEDENLAKLKKACDEVVKKLVKNKPKVVSYTLIALDPEVSAENDDVVEVNDIITKHWKTFVSNTKDTPLTTVRAVILQSLQTLSETNIIYSCLIWLTGRNAIKYFKLDREKDLLREFLSDIGNRVEREAESNWSLNTVNASLKIENLEINIGDIVGVTVDKSTLTKKLEDASGPHNQEGEPNYDSPNRYWSNQPQHWSYQFAPRAAEGIATVVNSAFKEQNKQISANQSKIQKVLNQLISNFESVIVETQNEILQKNNLLHMRTQLLWWKEAAYSKALDENYRKLNSFLLEIIIAVDYANLVPYLYPVSADYFLKETHKDFINDKEEKIKISDLLSKIEENKERLQKVLGDYIEADGRLSFLSFLKGIINGRFNSNQFNAKTGIDSTTEITKSEFVLWMFHDFQAQKIVSIR
jgi:hypothetical protein